MSEIPKPEEVQPLTPEQQRVEELTRTAEALFEAHGAQPGINGEREISARSSFLTATPQGDGSVEYEHVVLMHYGRKPRDSSLEHWREGGSEVMARPYEGMEETPLDETDLEGLRQGLERIFVVPERKVQPEKSKLQRYLGRRAIRRDLKRQTKEARKILKDQGLR